MKVQLLYRGAMLDKEEKAAIKQIWHDYAIGLRTEVKKEHIVIGRMSVLPYYSEVYHDIQNMGGMLINDHWGHEYIASMAWYHDFEEFTFPTWFDIRDIPSAIKSSESFVVKGKTNSKKQEWSSKMFAKTGADLSKIIIELNNDSFIGPQGLVFRQFVPLETFDVDFNGMPIVNEWRVFCMQDQILCSQYYWEHKLDDDSAIARAKESFDSEGTPFVKKLIKQYMAVNATAPFYVLDIAKGIDGKWYLVEINDGQMSGLNGLDPVVFYAELGKIFKL